MAIVNPHRHTEQEILNSSFDETYGVSTVLPLEVDPSGAVVRKTSDLLAVKVTVSGTITYVGEAAPGSAQSAAVWRCMKIDKTTGTVITWADSNTNFDNVATDLTALTYG